MGFDFNSILNNNIDNTYIDNVQWNLRIDNLFYICKTVKYKDVDGNLYNTEITKDKFNNIEIKYTDINENYEFILQFINENQNQIVPYIEVIDLYNNHINNEDIAEQICNFLTTLFNTIKEQSLIHINRIFIKPEIVDQAIYCMTIFNMLFNHLYNNIGLDVFIDDHENNRNFVIGIILGIDEAEVDKSYETYQLIIDKIKLVQSKLNIPKDNFQIKNFQLYDKSITDIKKLEEWLIFLQGNNIYENINTNIVSNILFKVWDKNTLQYFIKQACHDLVYRKFNPWFYYIAYLQDQYEDNSNSDIISAFMGVIYTLISGCNISYIINDIIEDKHNIQLLKEVNNIILDDIENKGFIFQNILSYYKKEALN